MQIQMAKPFYKQFCKLENESKTQGSSILNAVLAIVNNEKTSGINKEKINYYWSFRVNDDIRIITHDQNGVIALVYVGHHDDAYRYCNSTKPTYCGTNFIGCVFEEKEEKKPVNLTYDYLKEYGFDRDTINALNLCKDDKEVENLIKYYAPEYRELILSKGKVEEVINGYSSEVLVLNDDKELEKALSLNLPDWCVYLHPSQIRIRDYPSNKNLLVKGGPGTGKTVAMVWRYVNLYRQSEQKKPVFLCRSATTALIVKSMIKQIDDVIEPIIAEFPQNIPYGQTFSYLMKFSHVVIDEAQDLSNYVLKMLVPKLAEANQTLPRFSIALDFNQPILNVENKKLFKKLEGVFDVFVLKYCYRCTKQILDSAIEELTVAEENQSLSSDPETLEMDCALYGNDVIKKSFDNDDNITQEVEKIIEAHKLALDNNQWCIIFSGYFNDKLFEGLSKKYPSHVLDSEQAKGNEYFMGVVLHYWGADDPKTSTDYKKLKYEPYVSLTRFRDMCYFFRINKRFCNYRNLLKSIEFHEDDVKNGEFKCDICGKIFKGVPARRVQEWKNGGLDAFKYCKGCWAKTNAEWSKIGKRMPPKHKRKKRR